jgi:hypothetical protein
MLQRYANSVMSGYSKRIGSSSHGSIDDIRSLVDVDWRISKQQYTKTVGRYDVALLKWTPKFRPWIKYAIGVHVDVVGAFVV